MGPSGIKSHLSPPQASNPLYKHPISTHFVETDFSMYSKSYNGGLHWSLSTGRGGTGPTSRSRRRAWGGWWTEHTHPSAQCTPTAMAEEKWLSVFKEKSVAFFCFIFTREIQTTCVCASPNKLTPPSSWSGYRVIRVRSELVCSYSS